MRPLLLLLALAVCLCAGEAQPADLGGPAPGFEGLNWIAGGAPPAKTLQALVFWASDAGPDQPALTVALALAEAGKLEMALVCDRDDPAAKELAGRAPAVHHAIATPDATTRWLGSSAPPLPGAALVGTDGVLLWRGNLTGLSPALARERAGGFDRTRLAATAKLRAELRAALAAEADKTSMERALELTGRIIAIEPVDDEAVHLRIDLCRHLGKREEQRQTLAALPLDQVSAELANELAWARATDEDLSWRHPDLALRLSEHAHRLAPDDPEVEDTYARTLYLIGLIDEAVAASLRAVSLAPEDEVMRASLDYYREVQALRDERRRAPAQLP